jgi:4-hydroxy-2-oxoheptanedioate aldolase
LDSIARVTVEYKRADYLFTSGANETFVRYMGEITKAGGSVRTHPFGAKIGVYTRNASNVEANIVRQLNAGQVTFMAEAVGSAQEVRDIIKAMRFATAGGTRPDSGYEVAAAFWGVSKEQYKQKADVWPLNPNGELLLTVIIESVEGLEKVREIVAEPGVSTVWVGWGTLNGVVGRDQAAREAAAQKVLAACKEFRKPCGFPTNNPADMELRMGQGFSVFIMQSRDEAGMAAIETGRRLSGRNQ